MNDDVHHDDVESWHDEIHRRLKEIDQGKVKLVPWSKAQQMIFREPKPRKEFKPPT